MRRRGLTLVEIVIVLAVLLTLLGLLSIYIVRQRENALCVQCADNLRRLGEAAIRFCETMGGEAGGGFLPAARIADGYATWAVQIAPALMSEGPLLKWDMRRPYAEQTDGVRQVLPTAFICPARARVRSSFVAGEPAGAVGDYAGVAGTGARDWTGPDADGPIILAEVVEKKDDLLLRWRGRVTLADLTRGTEYTLLIGEKHVPPAGLGQARYGDGCIYDGGAAANAARIGGQGHPLAADPSAPYHDNFGSYHPDICQFALADTSVRPLAVSMDATLLGKMMTRD
jgi:prepilin-type N-terminal cleavage/methylation domain-containing protein